MSCFQITSESQQLLVFDVQGRSPDNEETVALFHLLSQANVDLRQPVSLEQQLMEDNDMDADVGLAMVQLLKVTCLAVPMCTHHKLGGSPEFDPRGLTGSTLALWSPIPHSAGQIHVQWMQ